MKFLKKKNTKHDICKYGHCKYDHDKEKRSIYKKSIARWSIGFLLLAAICFAGQNSFNTSFPFWSKICNLLATCFLTTSIFSIIITLADFTRFARENMKSIVMEHDYIASLSSAQLSSLQSTIDSTVLGYLDSSDKKSLYDFVRENTETIFRSPYRRDFHDNYCLYPTENDNYWLAHNTTTYQLCHEHLTLDTILSVPCTMWIKYLKPEDIIGILSPSLVFSVNQNSYKLTISSISPDEKFVFEETIRDSNLKCNPKISINVDKENKIFKIDCEAFIDKSDLPSNLTHLNITIDLRYVTPKCDNNLLIDLTYPTFASYYSCTIIDPSTSYRFSACPYALKSGTTFTELSKNTANVRIVDWAFKGHGAAIVWHPMPASDDQTTSHSSPEGGASPIIITEQ